MNESALKALIDTLQASKDSWEIRLDIFSAMVVLGVIAELVFVIREFVKDRRDWKHGAVHPPDKPSWLWLLLELGGVAFVSIGVAGELWVNVKTASLETQIRNANANLVLLLENRVQNVAASAQSASTAAERASESSDQANLAVGEAQKKLSVVAEEAKTVDRSLAMTQFLLSRRVLNPDQLKSDLERYKGTPITFRSYMNDGDGYFLCIDIVSVARSAGILTTDECGRSTGMLPPTTGIAITGPDDETMAALSATFGRATAFGATSGPYGKAAHSPIWIVFIGVKSPFFIGQARPAKVQSRK